ncbi:MULTISPECIES: anaerobic ribonucleoside-triphosphate reductase [Clostridium]|nr:MULTISPECIES: anaerobic ribonucleoside-triphosphate reductase [Clostridium]MDB2111583.1 anaerobic ribonucleoside-triphosphate reductase [Clostridium paraputrificum]MDC0803800.1 anaerobic ribonucleoside-triphosphate reductase [Clostridium paraputrificum]MDU1124991.1 anaerobic ribonucleoside-triphosphate reductase [Clostridium sp.]MDU1180738.1 anaerobic ribonucleoside-triphosphate reductase [Clostridium sp.]MDU1227242.1 anaerobic ribonucleoside-triphosphate reductase [Clostridium sp.]
MGNQRWYDIGTNFWNKGRTAEIGDRVLHL